MTFPPISQIYFNVMVILLKQQQKRIEEDGENRFVYITLCKMKYKIEATVGCCKPKLQT